MNSQGSQKRQPEDQHYLGTMHARKRSDTSYVDTDDGASILSDSPLPPLPEPRLPDLDLPQSELDLTTTFASILAESEDTHIVPEAEPEMEKVQKRASNVLKLSMENEKLKAELRAMNERLEAAERRQQELREAAERASKSNAQVAS